MQLISYIIVSLRIVSNVYELGGFECGEHDYLFQPQNKFPAGGWFHYIQERECIEVGLESQ